MKCERICERKECETPLKDGQSKFCSRQCYKTSGQRNRNMDHPPQWHPNDRSASRA